VAVVVAVVLVHPVPLVGILALVTVSVLTPLYFPATPADPLGAAVIVQPEMMFDVNLAPAFGMVSVIVYGLFEPLTDSFHVPVVVMASVQPEESVQPLIVGGAESVTVSDGVLGVTALPEKLVQLTVIGTESMSPLNVILVPDLSAAVTFVPAGSVA